VPVHRQGLAVVGILATAATAATAAIAATAATAGIAAFVFYWHRRPSAPGGVKGYLPRTRLAISLRNLYMKMMTAWPMRGLLAKQFQKADGIALNEYARQVVPAR
jgi:hypothetical protein